MNDEDRRVTTLIFNKDLHKKAKGAAAISGKTLGVFLDEAIQEKLEREGFIEGSVEKKQSAKRRRRK